MMMNTAAATAGWAYFDPDFDGLSERLYGPACRVTIDNESLGDCTMIKIDCVKKQGLLLEVVQVLTDMNLTILKGYISSDAGWFMDVFHVKDENGKKVTNQNVINYIQKALGASKETAKAKLLVDDDRVSSSNIQNGTPKSPNNDQQQPQQQPPRAIEMTGRDRPGLLSEISAALADLHINVVEAHAWSHNARLACIAYISDQHQGSPIDNHRLAAIEHHLTTVLRATTIRNTAVEDTCTIHHQQPDPPATAATDPVVVTDVERRLHQLMLSVRDFDRPNNNSASSSSRTSSSSSSWMAAAIPMSSSSSRNDDQYADDEEEGEEGEEVFVESCKEKGYSIVTVSCKDRRRLMFDTVCTLTDMHYVIFHASVDSRDGFAFQEYFIRHADGCPLNTHAEKHRVKKCLKAAIQRRVCEGVRLELWATNRVGLLSDITRVLRENGLAVVRADVETQGEKAVNAFYVRDMSGSNDVDVEFMLSSMRSQMGGPHNNSILHLAVKHESTSTCSASSSSSGSPDHHQHQRPRFSISDVLKSHIGRFSHNFVAIT
ncbi:OLC1v1027988C1 [Oldenlandia corymbosa var. corymbosa]|uniref:ACT domain-containing protein ACR n=1 Tax=Oldenlandia corymbosa var. corymbosa TaxID=529605 RepID=A0AAV1CBA1_OLDCO|nr:OLC1v1027988C1 [Oldenlandia corymbosa var. corymbosa]